MAIYGYIWPCMAIYGHINPYMDIYGHIWPYMGMYGQFTDTYVSLLTDTHMLSKRNSELFVLSLFFSFVFSPCLIATK